MVLLKVRLTVVDAIIIILTGDTVFTVDQRRQFIFVIVIVIVLIIIVMVAVFVCCRSSTELV